MLVPERTRALELYARAVEIEPLAEAIDRGRMVSHELGRLDELIRLTQIELEHEADAERRERLTALVGNALLDLGDRNRAAAFLVGAAGQFPSALTIQDALGTISYDDDWRAEVDRLIDIAYDTDGEAGARVSLRAARILRMESPEDERYERLLQRVLDCDAYDESAHLLLDGFYAAAGRWDELEALQDRLVQAFPGSDEQAALCQRFSCSWIARGQHDRAADWCWRAIELGRLVYPIAALTMMRGIYAARRDWDRLLATIDALLATPLDEDSDIHAALLGGTIAWKAKRDLERAAHYFDRVRRVAVDSLLVIDFDDYVSDQRNPEVIGDEQRALVEAARQLGKAGAIDRVIEAWRKAVAADPSKRAPRRALARLLYRTERWRTLADALKDEEAHACRDDAERVTLLFQLAALYRDRLRQELLATATLQRIVELAPGNVAALDQLAAAFAEARRWPDAVGVLQRKLALVQDPVERAQLYEQVAELFAEKLANEAEAVKALEGAFALDPTRADLAERLERSYGKRREWDKLYALKEKQAAALEKSDEKLAAQLELARLATEKLKKPALVIAAWRGVLALEPRHDAALTALERAYAAADAHAELAEIYARRAEPTADAATRLAYLQKLAQLYTGELAQPARAIECWQEVRRLQPGHGRALDMLKRLYAAERAWDPLEALFADERRFDECARLFERHAAESEDAAVQLALWLRAGRIWRDEVGRRELAQRAFEKALALDGDNGAAIDALVALYEAAGDARRLAGVLALQYGHTADAPTKKARALALAVLHGRELHDAAGAFHWQLAAFELDPADGELRRELERLATRAGGWAALVERYEATAAARDDVDRVALWSVAATEKERTLGDVDGALATWQKLAALEPPPPAAIDALVRLYEGKKAWRELHDVYLRKLALAGQDASARRPIVIAMAALAEKQGDDARAIAAYRRLVEELGPDDATLDALERLYERAGALAEVEALLAERLALPADRRKRTALTFRLAEARRRRERPGDAIALYGEVLDDEPQHEGARAALAAICAGPTHRLEAALLLEPILRATSSMAELVDVLKIRVAHAGGDEAVALMHEQAWIEESQLGRRDDAFATLAAALRAEPTHEPTYDALEKLMAGDSERLAALYREVASRPLGIDGQLHVRCRLGALYRDRLGAPERALATFLRVLDLAADHDAADRAVEDLLTSLGRHAELAERLRASLSRQPQSRARRLRLAALYERELADGGAALGEYARLLAEDAHDGEALAGLERLFAAGVERQRVAALLMPNYRARGRAADLVRVWAAALVEADEAPPVGELLALAREAGQLDTLRAAFVAAPAGRGTRPPLRLALAEVERARGDHAAAEKILRQLLDGDADNLEALRALDALYAETRRPAERAPILARRAAREEPAARVPLLLALAELQADALGDTTAAHATLEAALALGDDERVLRALARVADDERAVALWQRLRAQKPDDAEALAALAALFEHLERWRELAAVLEQQLGSADDETAPPLVERLALVWTRLGDAARAEAAWRRLAALRPEAADPLHALARLLRAQERWSELAELFERLVTLEPTAAATAKQLARLETGTLERPERAVTAWQRVLTLDDGDDEALAALDALYARTGRAGERRAVLARRAERALASGRADAVALAVDAAATTAADGDAAAAAQLYERVLAVEPLHAAAGAFLEAHHRERGDWPALVALLRLRARHRAGVERGELLAQVSAVEERELGDARAAFASLLEALEADGRFAVYGEDLRRLAAAIDGAPLLCATLQRRAAAARGAERGEAYLDLGAALEESKQPAAAIEAYRALLAVEPTNASALERLQALYRAAGHAALLDVLARRAELAGDRDDQLALYRELAAEAGRMERWGRAVEAHRRLAELDPRGERRSVELYRAGVIYRDQLAEFDEALGCFTSAADIYSADGLEPPSELAEALARLKRRSARAQGQT